MARKYGKKASEKVERALHEMKRGQLKSGSSGKKVTRRTQAIAIGLSQARRAGGKVPPAPNRHSTRRTPAQLDKEIVEFLANPKVGEPKWERDWAGLLTEKHSKARLPTVDEIARALRYIEHEFIITDGRINGELWAEGLAFGRYPGDSEDKIYAKEVLKQLPVAEWLHIAERANYLAQEQGDAARYLR